MKPKRNIGKVLIIVASLFVLLSFVNMLGNTIYQDFFQKPSAAMFFSKPTDTVTQVKNELMKQIREVSARYAEPNPTIVKAVADTTDGPTHKPMYVVFLKGNFIKGNLKANNLEFSILADGSQAWAIRAFDDDNTDIWLDN